MHQEINDWLNNIKDIDVINQFNGLKWNKRQKPVPLDLSKFKVVSNGKARPMFTRDMSDKRGELYTILTSFPPTGLYGKIDLDQFRSLILRIFSVFMGSPRNQTINEINSTISKLGENIEVQSLYKALNCSSTLHMFDLARAFYRFSPGKRYKKIIDSEARYNILLDQVRPDFLANIRRKINLKSRDSPLTKDELDFKIMIQMAVIEGKKRHQLNEKMEKILSLWNEVQNCPRFKTWSTIQTLWKKYAFEDLIDQFTQLENKISSKRRTIGKKFELEKHSLAVKEVTKRLGYQPNILEAYTSINWTKNNKLIGEADIVLVEGKKLYQSLR